MSKLAEWLRFHSVADGVAVRVPATHKATVPEWYQEFLRDMRLHEKGLHLSVTGRTLEQRALAGDKAAAAERADRMIRAARLRAGRRRFQQNTREGEAVSRDESDLGEDNDGASWYDDPGFTSMDVPSIEGPQQPERYLKTERLMLEDKALLTDRRGYLRRAGALERYLRMRERCPWIVAEDRVRRKGKRKTLAYDAWVNEWDFRE